MAYETDTAADLDALLLALQTFAQANGWTLTGNVLSKGACFTSLVVDTGRIIVRGGTAVAAIDGPEPVYWGAPSTHEPLAGTLTYHFHAHGDELFALLNWSTHFWTLAAFGASPAPGLPGTGAWYAASYAGIAWERMYYGGPEYFHSAVLAAGSGLNGTGLFWGSGASGPVPHYVHHGLDGGDWSQSAGGDAGAPGASASAHGVAGPLLIRTPNAWNEQAILLPVQPYIGRASGKVSIVAELAHARFVSIANYSPGDVITLGPDQWKVYPFYRKGAESGPASDGHDTGYLGLAIRYDGA